MNSRITVLAVVAFLGLFALVALGCTAWLIHDHTGGTEVAVIATPMGLALGGLTGMLASTRTEPPNPPGP